MPGKLLTAEEALKLARAYGWARCDSFEERKAAAAMAQALLDHFDALDTQEAELAKAKAEADALVSQAAIRHFGVERGTASLDLTAPRKLVAEMANAMAHMLDEAGATNYVEMKMIARDLMPYVITVRRHNGKTPHELRQQAERERDEALAALAALRATTEAPNG